MEIKRVIGGVEHTFRLTNEELRTAFYEQQDVFDLEDIKNFFDYEEDADLRERYGLTYDELAPMFDEMAYEMRRNMDKYDMDFEYARSQAIEDVLARNLNQ